MNALQDWWLPVAAADQLVAGRCLAARHFEQALALWTGPQGPVAFEIQQGYVGFGWYPIRSGRPPEPAEFAQGAALLRGR